MFESFISAFIIYFVVIDPIGNAPIFLAITEHQTRSRKFRTAIEGTLYATAIMLFFTFCGVWIFDYLNITESAFKIAGGLILFLVSLDMLSAKRQQRKREESTDASNDQPLTPATIDDGEGDNISVYPLATPLLAGPSAIMSVIVVNASFSSELSSAIVGYASLLAVMLVTGIILCLTVLAQNWLNEKITMVFSRITAIILAGLSVQYVIDGLSTLRLITLT